MLDYTAHSLHHHSSSMHAWLCMIIIISNISDKLNYIHLICSGVISLFLSQSYSFCTFTIFDRKKEGNTKYSLSISILFPLTQQTNFKCWFLFVLRLWRARTWISPNFLCLCTSGKINHAVKTNHKFWCSILIRLDPLYQRAFVEKGN